MNLIHRFALLCAGGLAAPAVCAQAHDLHAEVRAALARCVQAWNRHDPPAFGEACLTEDVWFSESNDSFYKRNIGRARMLGMFDYNLRHTELQWEVVRVTPRPDGTVAVQLKQRVGVLPRTASGYSQSFDSDPSFARLRSEHGTWKVYFFTSHPPWARELLQALDKPEITAAQSAAKPAAPDAPVRAGTQPPAYAMQFGAGLSCFYCHGNRPVMREDGARARIIPTGAAAESAAALRQAMATSRAGGPKAQMLADPALTDERLDTIRRWLRELRDGHAELQAGGLVVIRNLRSERDRPARLALLRAEGGWRLPANAGCREGRVLAGGAQCEIRLSPGAHGALVFRFAASPGLEPQPVRLALD
jgi:hypothetical protein